MTVSCFIVLNNTVLLQCVLFQIQIYWNILKGTVTPVSDQRIMSCTGTITAKIN